MNIRKLLLFCGFAVVLASCSSDDTSNSGGSSVQPVDTIAIEGMLIDPAIEGARLELVDNDSIQASVCGTFGNQPCVAFSNADGSFTFNVDKSVDTTGYQVRSFGGVDTMLATSFLGIQFSAPLSLFTADADGNYNIMVTPVTTIVSIAQASGATPAMVSAFLGISADNLTANPMENADVFKLSYYISNLLLDGVTVQQVIGAVMANMGSALMSDTVIDAIYAGNAAAAADMKALVASMATVDFTNVEAGIEEVANNNRLILINSIATTSLANYPTSPAMPSDNYTNNVNSLIDRLEMLTMKTIPADKEILSSIIDNLVANNAFYGDYTNYDNVTSFNAELANLTAESQAIADISAILDIPFLAKVYIASTPLATPLANNSSVLADYYFKSDISNTQKALSIVNNTDDDSILDAIYAEVIKAYATYGLHELAANFAEALIRGTQNRAVALYEIGKIVAGYDKPASIKYYDMSNEIFESMVESIQTASSSSLNSYADDYVALVQAMLDVDEVAKAEAIISLLKTDILPSLSVTVNPTQATFLARIYNGYRDGVEELIAAGEYETALARLDTQYEEAIDYEDVEGGLDATIGQNYASLAKSGAAIALHYINDATKKADALKYTDIADSKRKTLTTATNQQGTFDEMSSALYLKNGYDNLTTEFETLFGDIDSIQSITTHSNTRSALTQSSIIISLIEGWDKTEQFLEEYIVLDNSTDTNYMRGAYWYTNMLTYTSASSHGIASRLLLGTDAQRAEGKKALEYNLVFLNDYVNNDQFDNNSFSTISGVIFSSGGMDRFDERYGFVNGYLRIADMYIAYNDMVGAVNTLDNATKFVDNGNASLNQATAYSYLAYYYKLVGDTLKSEATFQKALDTNVPNLAGVTPDVTTEFYIGIASDYYYRDMMIESEQELGKALLEATNITDVGDLGDAYSAISINYSLLGNMNKAKEVVAELQEKIEALTGVTDEDKNEEYINSIITTLAELGLPNEAYSKAVELFSADESNFNDAIEIIAATLAGQDDFEDSPIAFSDTDKDGKPDFFLPFATQEQITASGLELDTDIDGDGILNEEDYTPFFANPVN